MKRKCLFFGLLLPVVLLGWLAPGCSSCDDEDRAAARARLEQSVERYWQTQIEGRWHESWTFFSAELIKRRATDNPAMFGDVTVYANGRADAAKRSPMLSYRILEIKPAPDMQSAEAQVGAQIRGRGRPLVIRQHWRWYPEQRKWLLADDPAGRPAPADPKTPN